MKCVAAKNCDRENLSYHVAILFTSFSVQIHVDMLFPYTLSKLVSKVESDCHSNK